jgi:tight adherence protein B
VSRARLLLVAAALALLSAPAANANPAFELRQVDVAAYPVIRLVVHSANPSSFPSVFENGTRVTGLSYDNLGASKAIVIAVDRSQSMTGTPLKQAAAAAQELVQRKRNSDQVEVVTFGSKALAQTSFSQSAIDANTALASLGPDPVQGTAFYDAVILSATDLQAQTLPGRVLVLLTDGHDFGSLASLGEALRAARAANMVVYAIALGNAADAPLRRLAATTGGSFYSSPTSASLSDVYRQVGAELDHTWKVSYTTTARPGDRLSISVGSGHALGTTLLVPGRPSTQYKPLIPQVLVNKTGGIFVLVAVVATLIFLAVARLRAVPRAERLRQLVWEHTDARSAAQRRQRKQRPTFAELMSGLNERLRGIPQMGRIERLVAAAAIPASAATVLVASVCVAFMLSLLAGVLTGSGFMIFLFFLLGFAGPLIVLRTLAKRRIAAVEGQLPDVLATIASSLRVGHGLKQALQTVAADGAPPISIELRRVLAEARLGRPLEEALVSMCERLESEDLIYVATAVDVQSQVGGSLAGVFETVAETVRARQQLRRRVRAVTSTGRSTATAVAGMPFAFLGFLLLLSPHYVTPFLNSHIGHVLMVASVISIAIGGFLLSRIVSMKV